MSGSVVKPRLFAGRLEPLSRCKVDHTLCPDPLKTPDSPPSSLGVYPRDGTTPTCAKESCSTCQSFGILQPCPQDRWKSKGDLSELAYSAEWYRYTGSSYLECPPVLLNDDTTCSSQFYSKPETLTQDFCDDERSESDGGFDVRAPTGEFGDDADPNGEHNEAQFPSNEDVWCQGEWDDGGRLRSPQRYNFDEATHGGRLLSADTEVCNLSGEREGCRTLIGNELQHSTGCLFEDGVPFVYPSAPAAASIRSLSSSQSCISDPPRHVGQKHKTVGASLCGWFVWIYLKCRKVVNFAIHLEEKALRLIGKTPSVNNPASNLPFSAPIWRLREARWRDSQTSVCISEAVGTFTLTLILYATGIATAAATTGKAIDLGSGLKMLLLGGRLPLLLYVFASSVGLHFNPALLYASYVASPASRNLAFTNLLAFHQYLAAAAAAAVAWLFCGGSGLVASAFRPPPHRSLLQLAFAEATAAFLVCLASLHLRQVLSKLAAAFHGEERPLACGSAQCSYLEEPCDDNLALMEADGLRSGANSNRSFSLHTFRACALLVLLLILLILHTPSPTALNPAVAYTAAWLARADEGFVASAPSWQGAYSWMQFFVLFSFAPYMGAQASAVLWSKYGF